MHVVEMMPAYAHKEQPQYDVEDTRERSVVSPFHTCSAMDKLWICTPRCLVVLRVKDAEAHSRL